MGVPEVRSQIRRTGLLPTVQGVLGEVKMYKCYKCGEVIKDPQKLEGLVRCPRCGFRIMYKLRQPAVRRIKAL